MGEVVRPVSWDWPAAENGVSFLDWHDSTCSFCGEKRLLHRASSPQLVLDHDHETHMIRGYLCNSCNTREGTPANRAEFRLYYQRTPAMIYGLEMLYRTAPVSLTRATPKDKPLQVGFRVSPDEMLALKRIAATEDRSVSYVALQMMRRGLELPDEPSGRHGAGS